MEYCKQELFLYTPRPLSAIRHPCSWCASLNLLQVLVEQEVVHADVLAADVQVLQVVGEARVLADGRSQILQVLLLHVVGHLRIVVLGRLGVRRTLVDLAGCLEKLLLSVQHGGHGRKLVHFEQAFGQHVLAAELEVASALSDVLDDVLASGPRAVGQRLEVGMEAWTVLNEGVKLGGQQHVLVGHLQLAVGKLTEIVKRVSEMMQLGIAVHGICLHKRIGEENGRGRKWPVMRHRVNTVNTHRGKFRRLLRRSKNLFCFRFRMSLNNIFRIEFCHLPFFEASPPLQKSVTEL